MTRRKDIIDLLKKQSMNATDLSIYFGVTRKEILNDMPHVKLSVQPPERLKMKPAQCDKCGFVFREERIKPPSRCPKCKGERIAEPAYYVE
jgi:predicted Zn-ribbon and HTH transcriptional regulator